MPCCWALLATQLSIMLLGVALANLTDLKFGFWLTLAIAGELLWNTWASQAEYPMVHPAFLLAQMAIGAARGAHLLEGPHWFKTGAAWVGNRVGSSFRSALLFLLRRQPEAKIEMPKAAGKVLQGIGVFGLGPILCALVDLRFAAVLLLLAVLILGGRIDSVTIGESFETGGIPLWVVWILLATALIRGVQLIRQRRDHWIWELVS